MVKGVGVGFAEPPKLVVFTTVWSSGFRGLLANHIGTPR
jgi:hypothetical protein